MRLKTCNRGKKIVLSSKTLTGSSLQARPLTVETKCKLELHCLFMKVEDSFVS